MSEIWKDIQNFKGRYQVSNLGRIKSLTGYAGKLESIRRGGKDHGGYLRVDLWKKGIQTTAKVHRLVLAAFVGPSTLQVNHKNGIKTDNRLENLEYCTGSGNQQHAYKNGLSKPRRGSLNGMAKLTEAQALAIYNDPARYGDIARKYKVSYSLVSQIKYKCVWRHIHV